MNVLKVTEHQVTAVQQSTYIWKKYKFCLNTTSGYEQLFP